MSKRLYCDNIMCLYSSKASINLQREQPFCLLQSGKFGRDEFVTLDESSTCLNYEPNTSDSLV